MGFVPPLKAEVLIGSLKIKFSIKIMLQNYNTIQHCVVVCSKKDRVGEGTGPGTRRPGRQSSSPPTSCGNIVFIIPSSVK